MNETTYSIEDEFVKMTKFGFGFFALMTAAALAVALFYEDAGAPALDYTVVMLLFGSVFGGFAVYGYRVLKSLPYLSVSIDDDGLWSAHTLKADGLVPWTAIHRIQQKGSGQKLVLRDDNGTKLVDLHYQLGGFDELRSRLIDYVNRNYAEIREPTFAKGKSYYVLWALTIGALVALAVYSFVHYSLLYSLGLVVLIMVFATAYATSYYTIYVSENALHAKSIANTKRYDLKDIKDIKLVDYFAKGSRGTNVAILFADKSEFNFPSMDRSAIDIYIMLKNALSTFSKVSDR